MGCKETKQIDPLADFEVFTKYDFGMKLGSGETCQVHEAEEKGTGHCVAIKSIVKAEALLAGRSDAAVKREAEICSKLQHPHIVGLYSVFEDPQIFFIVFELLEGGTLFERLESEIVLAEEDAPGRCKEMLSALSHVHSKRIIHRDLRPESWLFTGYGEDGFLKLTNFGLSEHFREQNLSEPCGTLHYVAPEVLRGSYGLQADVWTLGVVMFLALFGSYPFDGESCSSVMTAILTNEPDWSDSCYLIHDEVKNLLKQMLAKDPERRLTCAEALKNDWLKQRLHAKKDESPQQLQEGSLERGQSFKAGLHKTKTLGLAAEDVALLKTSKTCEIKGAPGQARRTSCLVTLDLLKLMANEADKTPALHQTAIDEREDQVVTHPNSVEVIPEES